MENESQTKQSSGLSSRSLNCSTAGYKHAPFSTEEIARRAIFRFLFLQRREASVGATQAFAVRAVRKRRVKIGDFALYDLVMLQIERAAERGAIVMFEEHGTSMVALPQNRTQPVLFAAPGL